MLYNKQTNQELEKVGDSYQYDFGARNQNSKVSVTLIVKGNNIKNVTSTADCSCTSTSPNVIDKDTVEIDIIYKSTHLIHNIKREIFVNYSENGENKLDKIKITGQIIK